ncbi:hypothetical protein MAMP_02811 [Methylophaga aminisulfidivorans MP]|uniref:Toxin CptA n=1 Tax=Methylophaga aminisulfidivorans MP TaxID=1026882 RepID=F5SUQ3_9GAMM|nr:protein YgfX [Methylophaga aminisulfidivorans]EGL55817.1 hypothetical protein MAMP_02811 [Methylophaga aminisulfidivorans MP]
MKVTITKSRGLFVYMVSLHILAIILLLWSMDNNRLLVLFLTVLVCGGFIQWYRRYTASVAKNSLIEVSMNLEKNWFLRDETGAVSGPFKLKSSIQFPYVMFIYFRTRHWWQSHSLMIPIDAVDKQDWRRLRAQLRDPDVWAE